MVFYVDNEGTVLGCLSPAQTQTHQDPQGLILPIGSMPHPEWRSIGPNSLLHLYEPTPWVNNPIQDPTLRPFQSTPLTLWNGYLPRTTPSFHLDRKQPDLPRIHDPIHLEYRVGEQLPYTRLRPLGSGRYASVDEVACVRRTDRKFARKVITNSRHSNLELFRERIWNEVAIIRRLKSHRHFIQVVETYSQGRAIGIVMTPVADMDLEHYLEQNSRPDIEDPMYGWFGCLAAGLDYLHQRKIRHRDIKPANILVKNGSVLYADFGIAKDFQDEATTSTSGYVDAKTPMYCAPEVAQECKRGRLSDVFSLGCVFLEMATTLLWFRDVSVAQFSNFRTTNESKAYHRNTQKTLHWLLHLFGLCGLSNSRSGNTDRDQFHVVKHTGGTYIPHCFPLEWCFGMLQPDPNHRITSSTLVALIELVNRWQEEQRATRFMVHEQHDFTKNPGFAGACCRLGNVAGQACSEPTLLRTWPIMPSSVVLDPNFDWDWDYANRELSYNATPPILRPTDFENIPPPVSGDTSRSHEETHLPPSPGSKSLQATVFRYFRKRFRSSA